VVRANISLCRTNMGLGGYFSGLNCILTLKPRKYPPPSYYSNGESMATTRFFIPKMFRDGSLCAGSWGRRSRDIIFTALAIGLPTISEDNNLYQESDLISQVCILTTSGFHDNYETSVSLNFFRLHLRRCPILIWLTKTLST